MSVTHNTYFKSTEAVFTGVNPSDCIEILNQYAVWRRKKNKPEFIVNSKYGNLKVDFESEKKNAFFQNRSLSYYFISEADDFIIRISDHWSDSNYDKSKKLNCGMISSCRWENYGERFSYRIPSQSYSSDLIGGLCYFSDFKKRDVRRYDDESSNELNMEKGGLTDELFKEGGVIDVNTGKEINKVYVSIKIQNEIKREEQDSLQWIVDYLKPEPFQQLKEGKLKGVIGVSTSKYNVSQWFTHRQCLIVMDFDKFISMNDAEQILYDDPYYLMGNNMEAMYRLYDNKERDKQEYGNILSKMFPKIYQEFVIESKINDSPYLAVRNAFDVYESSKFKDYVSSRYLEHISSPEDLALILVDYVKSGNWKQNSYFNLDTTKVADISVDDVLPTILKGIVKCGSVFKDESEWLIKDKMLNVPVGSQLFFKNSGYSNYFDKCNEIIDQYDLRSKYKISFVGQRDLDRYQSLTFKKIYDAFTTNLEQMRKNADARIVNIFADIRDEILKGIITSFQSRVKEKFAGDSFYSNDTEEQWDDIMQIPEFDYWFKNVIAGIQKILDQSMQEAIKTKNKQSIVYAKYGIEDYIRDERRKSIEELFSFESNYQSKIGQESFYTYLRQIVGDMDFNEYVKDVKRKIGSDLYRYFEEKEVSMLKEGGSADGGNVANMDLYHKTLRKLGLKPSQVESWENENRTEKNTPEWNRLNKRNPIVQKNAQLLKQGLISQKRYLDIVRKKQPIIPFKKVPALPTILEIVGALKQPQVIKGIIGFTTHIEDGTLVRNRLDIPAYSGYGVWVVAIHDTNKKIIGYGQTAVIKNVHFESNTSKALNIAIEGEAKSPIAFMDGTWVDEDSESARSRAIKYMNHKDWVQVGMNPFRHSWFYNKANGMPLVSAEEVIQVGALVLAKNPVETTPDDDRFIVKGSNPQVKFGRGGVSSSRVPRFHLGGNMSKHLAPNGKPSNLTHEQWHLVRTPEFKKWFGDWENDPENASKVVDQNGEPLVLYHFSTEKFNVFELKGNSDGFFFTPLKKDIEFSFKGNRQSYFLNIKILGVKEDIYHFNWSIPHYENRWIEDAKENKENGIVFIKYVPYKSNQIKKQGKKMYVAFEPNQIKLADGSNTTFDAENPDIRYDEGGEVTDDKPKGSSYAERVKENLIHMGTESKEWKAVPIIGFNDVDVNGKTKSLPSFDFPKNYQFAPSLYAMSNGGDTMNCELCGRMPIKTIYWIQNDDKKWTLRVGSECVKHFEEGMSGKQNLRQFKINSAEIMNNDLNSCIKYILDNFSKIKTEWTYNGEKKTRVWSSLYVGDGGGFGESQKLVSEYNKNGDLDILKNPKEHNRDTIWMGYSYDKIPQFDDKFYSNYRESGERDKQLLSWFKRNEETAYKFIVAIKKLAYAVNGDNIDLKYPELKTSNN